MRGHRKLPRFGRDCHGLPVQHDRRLGVSPAPAAAELGMVGYNAESLGIVER